MPRQRKVSRMQQHGAQQYPTGHKVELAWCSHEKYFSWRVLGFVLTGAETEPAIILAAGAAPTYPEAAQAIWLALVELDVLKEVAG